MTIVAITLPPIKTPRSFEGGVREDDFGAEIHGYPSWGEGPETRAWVEQRFRALFRTAASAAVVLLGICAATSTSGTEAPIDGRSIAAYHKGSVNRDHLLKSMIPLYLGWVASFVNESLEISAEDVEERIEALCNVFEGMKPYLIEHWMEGR